MVNGVGKNSASQVWVTEMKNNGLKTIGKMSVYRTEQILEEWFHMISGFTTVNC